MDIRQTQYRNPEEATVGIVLLIELARVVVAVAIVIVTASILTFFTDSHKNHKN